jgi:hypothetical protein
MEVVIAAYKELHKNTQKKKTQSDFASFFTKSSVSTSACIMHHCSASNVDIIPITPAQMVLCLLIIHPMFLYLSCP